MKLEIVDMPYDAIVHKVASGEIDIGMAAMTITADTSAVVNFSKSYSGSNQTLIVPRVLRSARSARFTIWPRRHNRFGSELCGTVLPVCIYRTSSGRGKRI